MDLAALVCFEDSLGDLTRRFVKNGAQLLVNLTNDGWFLETAGAEQHLHNALFRAVENRRPLVRCTNTGITASVDRNGRVDRWLKPFEQGFAVREIAVATQAPLTFYSQHGDWFSVLCSLFCAAPLIGVLRSRLRR
jgi:apolipoprotein N-acyltransferase